MPLKKQLQIDESNSLYVWKIEEELEFFGQTEFVEISNAARKLEKACTNYLLKQYFGINDLKYDQQGKPIPVSYKHISISHSKGYVAVAGSDKNIGIDIEEIGNKAVRISRKFRGKKDFNIDDAGFQEELYWTMIWSVKEACFKKYSHVEHLIFSNQIHCVAVAVNTKVITAQIEFSDGKKVSEELQYDFIDGFIVVYTL